MSDFEKFKGELPSEEKFNSLLKGKNINEHEYEHVLKVWNKFEMKAMKGYYDLYFKCDALLLADVFEKFKNNILKNNGLCPSHYLSAPALSWDAMLNNFALNINSFQILTYNCSLKKVWEVEFLIFLRDIAKPAISIWNLKTPSKNQNIYT